MTRTGATAHTITTPRLGRRAWLFGVASLLCLGDAHPVAAQPLVFRISTENTPTHFQTLVVQRFADTLAGKTRGKLAVEFHHSAQLFRDQDVIRALSDGKVDMAVPGNWQLDRYDPYVSALMLPVLMGRSAAEHHRFRDGRAGQLISQHLAESINVVVPGRWIDLGFAHVFTTGKAIAGYQDMAGMRTRIAGGAAIAAQVSAVGAVPTVVPWPDLPNVLQQGRIDGLLTTHETVASARLWDMGVQHATENMSYFAQYIPVVSRSCWERLSPDLRLAVQQSWESVVDDARAQSSSAQQEARRTLQAHGVRVMDLSPQALQAWRQELMKGQAALARSLGIPDTLLAEAERQFGRAP
ncbi:ABC transporter substrate-binding protein [Rhodoferax lacus]|uniref:ABC transporter substrate-binding protein n=1 Tax=Rhodoferax lacus TaxID=2184758 RepID=A0A3E1R9Z9_9BURK|nr:TRAP transporter substrate-binding protein DctP [Rhodoferax lacus]RFO95500.1 ABC transporter substrate-binding protein [Rhodoferax lacus]